MELEVSSTGPVAEVSETVPPLVVTVALLSLIARPLESVLVIAIDWPPVAMLPTTSDTVSLSVSAPTVPLVVRLEIASAPVSEIVPVPLVASVPAVSAPAPLKSAPEATETVSVFAPTLSEPDSVSVPPLTVVVPL